MTVELLRGQTTHQRDANFQVTALVSLFGLAVSLAVLVLPGSDIGTLMAFAG